MNIVIPLFENFELLDVTGPIEVLGYMKPTPNIILVADETVTATPGGVQIVPMSNFADCPQADVLLVPGGSGQVQMMQNTEYINFLKHQATEAKYVTSVCVGSLLLAAAGLLDGYIATTHWDSQSILNLFPEVTLAGGYPPYVICGNRVTSGGVSCGIDMALALVSILKGDHEAKKVQLITEYQPDPPFHCGKPNTAAPSVMGAAALMVNDLREKRYLQVRRMLE